MKFKIPASIIYPTVVLTLFFSWYKITLDIRESVLTASVASLITLCNKYIYKLPGDSHYNPLGFIELHIGRKAKRNKHKFYRICIETIKTAKELEKDVLFYTWHLKEEKLRKIFGNSIEITKPNIIEKVMNFFPAALMLVLPVPLPNPYIKCYIKTRELPESFIQKYIGKKALAKK